MATLTDVDEVGRPTRVEDPGGRVTYTTYDDVAHETRTYAGWAAGQPTGPTQVRRVDAAGGYTEVLTMSAAPHLTNGEPDGRESIGNLQTLSCTYLNFAGQVISSEAYLNLAGLVYSAATHLGVLNDNYYRTAYGYDRMGNLARVVAAGGTIRDTVYDGLGRAIAEYTGTNDTTTDGAPWTGTNAAASANMVKTAGYEYDNNGVGVGNLTKITAYPGPTDASARVTVNLYD